MKKASIVAILCLAWLLPLGAAEQPSFDKWFTGKTMRVDYFHSAGPQIDGEAFSLDRIVSDGPWPGSRTKLIDELDLGEYFFEVRDAEGGTLIYSRGFSSIAGEWITTSEVRERHRTFHESLRFPWPAKSVIVALKRRSADRQSFEDVWATEIDPASRFVNPADIDHDVKVWPVVENGLPATKVDLLFLAEGYTKDQLDKFHADAKRLAGILFSLEPFKSRKKDFNVWAVDNTSSLSGVSRPRAGQFRRNNTTTEYNSFDSERYVLSFDNAALRDVASAAPYDFIEILVNEKQYGGGGIYNFQATAAVDSGYAGYLITHEFAHHFAALADEYFTSPVAYETGGSVHPEPYEPNVTALHDPAKLKWKDLVEEGTPLPTPWNKKGWLEYQADYSERRAELRARNVEESVMDEFFDNDKVHATEFLSGEKYAGKVGAFEGASYEADGLYRSEADCIMFTRDDVGFCRVCSRAIERVIDQYAQQWSGTSALSPE
jgi:hypothetical protein